MSCYSPKKLAERSLIKRPMELESKVLSRFAKGLSRQQIANDLGITRGMVHGTIETAKAAHNFKSDIQIIVHFLSLDHQNQVLGLQDEILGLKEELTALKKVEA